MRRMPPRWAPSSTGRRRSFHQVPTTLVMAQGEITYAPRTENYHYEMELVFALKSGGTNITEADALSHIYGCAAGLDMTRRDLQNKARKTASLGHRQGCRRVGCDHPRCGRCPKCPRSPAAASTCRRTALSSRMPTCRKWSGRCRKSSPICRPCTPCSKVT